MELEGQHGDRLAAKAEHNSSITGIPRRRGWVRAYPSSPPAGAAIVMRTGECQDGLRLVPRPSRLLISALVDRAGVAAVVGATALSAA